MESIVIKFIGGPADGQMREMRPSYEIVFSGLDGFNGARNEMGRLVDHYYKMSKCVAGIYYYTYSHTEGRE